MKCSLPKYSTSLAKNDLALKSLNLQMPNPRKVNLSAEWKKNGKNFVEGRKTIQDIMRLGGGIDDKKSHESHCEKKHGQGMETFREIFNKSLKYINLFLKISKF